MQYFLPKPIPLALPRDALCPPLEPLDTSPGVAQTSCPSHQAQQLLFPETQLAVTQPDLYLLFILLGIFEPRWGNDTDWSTAIVSVSQHKVIDAVSDTVSQWPNLLNNQIVRTRTKALTCRSVSLSPVGSWRLIITSSRGGYLRPPSTNKVL